MDSNPPRTLQDLLADLPSVKGNGVDDPSLRAIPLPDPSDEVIDPDDDGELDRHCLILTGTDAPTGPVPPPPGALPMLRFLRIDRKIARLGSQVGYLRHRIFQVVFAVGDNAFAAGLTDEEAQTIVIALQTALDAR